MPRRRTTRGGFTLVEMIVAAVLLAVALSAALGAFAAAVQAGSTAERSQQAAILAQQHLGELETQLESLTPGEEKGEFGDQFAGFRWVQRTETTELNYLYRVTLTVMWGTPEDPKRREFVTYLHYNPEQNSLNNPLNGTNGGQNSPNGTTNGANSAANGGRNGR